VPDHFPLSQFPNLWLSLFLWGVTADHFRFKLFHRKPLEKQFEANLIGGKTSPLSFSVYWTISVFPFPFQSSISLSFLPTLLEVKSSQWQH
jgi:hypothetical protein